MKDQVDKLEEAGLEASQLNSALTTFEHQQNLEQIKTDTTDFIFVTPERFTHGNSSETCAGKQLTSSL
jgi:ATP-dependent DNA helicase RecQ